MVLVALAMVAIIAMAALSIDVITLYLAKQEAQRSADAAALAAGKVIALSGITGDPNNGSGNWGVVCGPDDGTNGLATRVAKAVANQNQIGGGPSTSPTVTYSSGGTRNADCTALSSTGFGVNPIITVQLSRAGLPTFFSRIWGNTGNTISATSTAEVFNPSNSGTSGSLPTGTIIPVQPRCVKPWVVPNQDPLHNTSGGVGICTGGATGNCAKIVNLTDGSIVNKGISLSGTGAGGIIGETFWLNPICRYTGGSCTTRVNPPQANYNNNSGFMRGPPNLIFAPGQVGTTPVIGVPSCTSGDQFEEAIEGCDQPTNYSCGLPPTSGGTNAVELSLNPDVPTANGVSCLIHQASGGDITEPTGQDYLSTPTMGQPTSYPFQIFSGSASPLLSAGLTSGSPISVSTSIVSLPIYDESTPLTGGVTQVTFVGFLQVFINAVDPYGNVSVTVLNVAGCSNGVSTLVGTAVVANSPVPVRLITPP